MSAYTKPPAKAKRPPKGMEGVTYIAERDPYGRIRRRKPKLADLERIAAVCERSREASNRLRKGRGWPEWLMPMPNGYVARSRQTDGLRPLPDNQYRQALAAALAQARAHASNGNGTKPIAQTTKRKKVEKVAELDARLNQNPEPLGDEQAEQPIIEQTNVPHTGTEDCVCDECERKRMSTQPTAQAGEYLRKRDIRKLAQAALEAQGLEMPTNQDELGAIMRELAERKR